MGKRLVITEKPSVARDIVNTLGGFSAQDDGAFWESDDFIVTFAVGHLLELPSPEDLDEKYKRWTLDTLPILPERFGLKPKSGSKERLSTIKKLIQRDDVGAVVNACDAGREGELIFRELVEYLKSNKPIERLWLQSMTKAAIKAGFQKLAPGSDYEGLSAAAHCRNQADWVIGMNATRALTRRLKTRSESGAWSAGRVQTPTLAMLVQRELSILEHAPKPYWRVIGTFNHAGQDYAGVWFNPKFKADDKEPDGREDRIFDEAAAKALIERLQGKPAVASESRKPSREAAPPLFDLTSLQREANRRFGWSARRTLNAAQRCYESHKVLTYPRTDTKALPEDYRSVVDEVIEALRSDKRFSPACAQLQSRGLLNTKRIFDDSKVTDHFAIVPTGQRAALSGDDEKLYELVARRFLGAFFPPAIWSRVERITEVEGERFRTRSRVLEEPGWRAVLGEDEGKSRERLAPLIPGQDAASGVPVTPKEYALSDEETKPPPRITEAGLLALMENAGRQVDDEAAAEAMKDSGIGTPATRADTIENLISKGYVMRAGRNLRPAVKGIRLIDILHRMKADRLASPALTGEMERDLNTVQAGDFPAARFMAETYDYAREIVELTKGFEFETLYPNEGPLGPCPLCSRPVYERSMFYRCEEPEGLQPYRRKKKGEPEDEGPQVVDCDFRIWKDKSSRYIDRRTVAELTKEGLSRPLDGFMTRQQRVYRGQLELVDGEVQIKRLAGGEEEGESLGLPEYEVDERPICPCPHCEDGEIVETRSTFICSNGLKLLKQLKRDETTIFPLKKREIPEGEVYCPALMPRTVCKREMSRDEAKALFVDKKTPTISDFISKRGRPFTAFLFLKDTGRHGFEFPPRVGADGKPITKKKTAAKKKTTKKKTTTKKAATKKAATKKKTTTKKAATKKKTTTKKAATKKKTTTKKPATKATSAD